MKIRILHLITSLTTGGAETMLFKLLAHMNREVFEMNVVSLTENGPVGERIQSLGIPVQILDIRRGMPNPAAILKVVRILGNNPPDILQTWMYHSDLIGGIAAKIAGGIPVCWNIRHGHLNPGSDRRSTIITAKICACLSRLLPVRIISCSEVSKEIHVVMGYAREKMTVIPNGFDLSVFKPDPAARASVKKELGLPENAFLIGMVGRFHPLKDHNNFVKAAGILIKSIPDVHFVLIGGGVTWENRVLANWINAAGLSRQFHLLGRRDDVPRLTAALDIASTSSSDEGFPNVIGEAMACEVPCVVTDVGDSALIVGDTGMTVPPGQPQALADAWAEMIDKGHGNRVKLGVAARERVCNNFDIDIIAGQYERTYLSIKNVNQ